MKYTEQQLNNWRIYEDIRQCGMFNMFDPRARQMTAMSKSEWVFCIEHYNDLKRHATQGAEQ
jgi:hypothetical protein